MYGMVIDSMGYGVELVHIFDNGEIDSYDLKEGESIITKGWRKASSMNKPKLNLDTEDWEETEPVEDEQIDICEPTDRERMEQIEGMVGMLAEQVAKQSLDM